MGSEFVSLQNELPIFSLLPWLTRMTHPDHYGELPPPAKATAALIGDHDGGHAVKLDAFDIQLTQLRIGKLIRPINTILVLCLNSGQIRSQLLSTRRHGIWPFLPPL